MVATDLEQELPFATLIARLPNSADAGVTAAAPPIAALASVQARRGLEAALEKAAKASLGLSLPRAPEANAGGRFLAVGSGPATWLVVAAAGQADPFEKLMAALGRFAAVTDQSGAYAALRLGGPRVRDLLAKGAFLDLAEDAFPPGRAAATQLAHCPVVFWRDAAADHFTLLCFRSYARTLWTWLSASAAEFGLATRG